ncbi:MAG TPA: hypothetical protein VGI82_05045 [Chitinophagaceae bacterium]|jgi:hypothetical protein
MKKRLTALFTATILFATATLANENIDPSLPVQNEFHHLFSQPTEVKWEVVSDFYKVSFVQSGQHLTAFFNPAGNIEAISRNISTVSLPLILQGRLQDKLASSWITDCFEMYGKNGTEYYVTIANANGKVLYVSNSDDWDKYKGTNVK